MRFDFIKRQFVETSIGGEKPALIGRDERWTWAQLLEQVRTAQRELSRFKPGTPVILNGRKECGMVAGLLACFELGLPYIPVDAMMPEGRLKRIAELSGATVLFRAESGTANDLRDNGAGSFPRVQDLAYIIFTSGSTGEPKGVQITYRNAADLVTWLASEDFGFSSDDIVLNQCSFGFDVSFFDTAAALHHGGTLVLQGADELKSEKPFLIADANPTVWSSTPSALSLALTCATFSAKDLPALKDFYLAGEVVHAALAQRVWRKFPEARIWNAYGPTEATVILTLVQVNAGLLDKYQTTPIGFVKPGTVMRTTAANGKDEGELLILGPNVSPGYLNRPDLNETRFFTEADGTRGYRTGDLGFVQDGMVFYKARMDNQIKLHGYRIELDEIDTQILKDARVEAAATVALRAGGDVKKLVCFLKPQKGVEGERLLREIKATLGQDLPYYMIPSDFHVVTELPYNSNQKVDRGALIERLTGARI